MYIIYILTNYIFYLTLDDNIIKPFIRQYLHPVSNNIEWQVINTFVHDQHAFTQGFQAKGNILYESTGLYGRSELRKVELNTGKILKRKKLEPSKFGEGITIINTSKIIQLTWKSQIGYVWNINTFDLIKKFSFTTFTNQGWGITYDNNKDKLYVSDGSEYIFTWDSLDFKEEKRVQVIDMVTGKKISKLNDLEYYRGTILANIWYDDRIIQINPNTGHVMKSWNFKSLVKHPNEYNIHQDCLNGIALVNNGKTKEVYLTGKFWSKIYHVRIPDLISLY